RNTQHSMGLKINAIIGIVCSVLFFSSCASRKNVLFASKYDAMADTAKTIFVANPDTQEDIFYRIKPNDMVAIRNLQNLSYISPLSDKEQTSGASTPNAFRVEEDGFVNLPAIGKVHLAVLTRQEANELVQSSYKESLLKDPLIELSIINMKVTMLGEFNRQGNFLLEKENTSLIEMIGLAGGLNPTANPGKLKIIRGNLQDPEIIYVNLRDINSLASPKLTLKNNDLIYVEQQKIYHNAEQVKTVSSLIQPVLLILNSALLIYTITRQ